MAKGEVPARGNVIPFIPARYIFSVLSSIGMAIIYGLKVNLSVAMVAMTNHTAVRILSGAGGDSHGGGSSFQNVTGREECEADPLPPGAKGAEDGPFEWQPSQQGIILSCYFWGYLVSQIPGSMIAAKFSAKWVLWFAVFINVACTILTPASAYWSIWAVVLMRVLEGIGGGVTFPANHTLIASWAPPQERSTISSIIYAGTALGTVISMLMAGVLAEAYGWASIFYVMGGLSCIWLVLWIIFVQDTPSQQPLIDQDERDYIVSSIGNTGHSHGPKVIPWKAFFTSKPFYGILIAHICNNWGWYMLLIELPIYMNGVLKFPIKENAIFTATPFLTLWFFSIAISKTLDTLRANNVINTTQARKIATMFASVIPAICLLALCFIGCRKMAAVVIAGIAVTSIGAMFSGFLSNHIDLSTNYAGILMAITNTAATLPGITVPLFVGKLITTDPTIASWQIIFGVTIFLYIIEIIAYLSLASGELQPWNSPEKETADPEVMTPLKDKQHSDYKTKEDA